MAAGDRACPGASITSAAASRVSVNQRARRSSSGIAGRPLEHPARAGAEGRHARHVCRHVDVARADLGLRAAGDARSRVWQPNVDWLRTCTGSARAERCSMNGSIVVAESRRAMRAAMASLPWPCPALRAPAAAASAGRRRARRSPTSSCSSAGTEALDEKHWLTAREYFRRADRHLPAEAATAPTPSSASATPTSARGRAESLRAGAQRVPRVPRRSTRPTSAPTTRSTSWGWRTSSRCTAPSATRPRRARRSASSTLFVERYPDERADRGGPSPAARGARSPEPVRVQRRLPLLPDRAGIPAPSIASRSCSSGDPEFTQPRRGLLLPRRVAT